MARPLNVALLGADEPLGEAILRLVEERGLGIGQLFPLTLAETDGCVTVQGAEEPLQHASEFDWHTAQVVVSASRTAAAARLEAAALDAGCRVIGFGSSDRAGRDALPGGLAIALHRVLGVIKPNLAGADVVAMLPVSYAGQEGVTELAEQTRSLFAMESPEPGAFPLQIAFNLIPQAGPILDGGESTLERDAASETRALLAMPDLAVTVTAVWVPVFYGAGLSLHVTGRDELDLAALRGLLAAQAGVVLMDAALPGTVPTPATDAQDSDTVFVGRLRQAPRQARHLAMWLVVDIARLEAARMVDWLENLIEK